MRIHALSTFLGVLLVLAYGVAQEDENSEDVFDRPMTETEIGKIAVPREEMMNEGSDTFETSTEMIELPANETIPPIQKTSVFTPMESPVSNFSTATIEMDSKEEDEDDDVTSANSKSTTTSIPSTTITLDVITFQSLPITVDEVADRRVLKEKEVPTTSRPGN
uniref:Uncharacterized protein n=1 Tax=Caenorhabditis japonica TaxID=281687 RepID=A0A8R1HXI1_CAEJA